MLIVLFLVSHFNFLFVPCGRLSWLPISFLLHVKYTLRIVRHASAKKKTMQSYINDEFSLRLTDHVQHQQRLVCSQ